MMDFPQYYHYYAQTDFNYNNIKQGNRNGLLYRNIGADGLKTGHANDAGYGLTASVKKGDRRLIAVVNGLKSNKERSIEAEALVNYGLANFTNILVVRGAQALEKIKVSGGSAKEVEMVSANDVILTLSKKDAKQVKTKIHYSSPAIAPIKAGDVLGELIIESNAGTKTYPLIAKNNVDKAGFITRIQNNLSSIFD